MDSVFTPLLQFAEESLIPIARIDLDRAEIEVAAADAMVQVFESETDRLLDSVDTALADGDIAAINEASQLAIVRSRMQLERTLFQTPWTDGFDLGAAHGIEEMRAAVSDVRRNVRVFNVPDEVAQEIDNILSLSAPQLINTDAIQAVVERVNLLAGNFADDLFLALRGHLAAAIIPQADTGEPISRAELLSRIQSTLKVGRARAQSIARTETTYALNTGRKASFDRSTLVDYVRFMAIGGSKGDGRTTKICRSRHGMLIPKNDAATLSANSPPLHVSCRSTLSPVMSRLSRFQNMVNDPSRRPENRSLEPLPEGWAF